MAHGQADKIAFLLGLRDGIPGRCNRRLRLVQAA